MRTANYWFPDFQVKLVNQLPREGVLKCFVFEQKQAMEALGYFFLNNDRNSNASVKNGFIALLDKIESILAIR